MIPGRATVGYLHPGHVSACFAQSLQDLLLHDITGAQRIVSHEFGQFSKECGSGGIAAGRNQLAEVVLDRSESEWLFMVDSDMGFAGDTMERLIDAADATERPVVGALAFAQKTNGRSSFYGVRYLAQPTLYRFVETDDRVGVVPSFDYPRDELIQVEATGGACLAIHRSALERIRTEHGDTWFDPIKIPKGNVTFSEDLSFCLRLQLLGIPLYVHTGVKTTHDKGGVYLDEEFFDRQQAEAR